MSTIVAVTVLGSFFLSLGLTYLARGWARRTGFVDRPGGHKGHAKPVALGGGVAIFGALALPLLSGVLIAKWMIATGHADWAPEAIRAHLPGIASKTSMVLAVLGGGLALHVMGLIDDVRPLGPGTKFVAEIVVAAALWYGFDIRAVEALGAWVSLLVTVFWIVLIINAFNFLDNMDGLSSGVAAIAASIFACSAMACGQIFVPVMAWVLVGAVLGFLVFNFSPASVFMGDAGSMVIGYFLSVLTVLTTYQDSAQQLLPIGVLVPVIVLAVPLYDVASVVILRMRAGVSPFRGDRRHFSHRLVKRGMSPRAAVSTIYLATAATSVSAVILPSADWWMALLIFGQCVCVVLIIAVLEHMPGGSVPEG
jgi:UDP-GlcNAc:undecaprenyl-phosphate GlcNAc-1-phosphate transferase